MSDFEQVEETLREADRSGGLVAPVYRSYSLAMYYAQLLEQRIGLLI